MKKNFKTFATILVLCTLGFAFSSCSNGSSGDEDAPKEIAEVITEGTVSPVTVIEGKRVAECECEDGTYIFTQESSGFYSSQARAAAPIQYGTWKLVKDDAVIYSGYFEGDISKFGTSDANITLNLTVEMAAIDGELSFVSETKEFEFTVNSLTFQATIPEVQIVEKEQLPAPVGEDPFAGKTFYCYDEIIYEFKTDGTVYVRYDDDPTISVASYSYNTKTKSIYIQYTSIIIGNKKYTKVNEMIAVYIAAMTKEICIGNLIGGRPNGYTIDDSNYALAKELLEKMYHKSIPAGMKRILCGEYEINGEELEINDRVDFSEFTYTGRIEQESRISISDIDIDIACADCMYKIIPEINMNDKIIVSDVTYKVTRTPVAGGNEYALEVERLSGIKATFRYIDEGIAVKFTEYPEELSELLKHEISLEDRN